MRIFDFPTLFDSLVQWSYILQMIISKYIFKRKNIKETHKKKNQKVQIQI